MSTDREALIETLGLIADHLENNAWRYDARIVREAAAALAEADALAAAAATVPPFWATRSLEASPFAEPVVEPTEAPTTTERTNQIAGLLRCTCVYDYGSGPVEQDRYCPHHGDGGTPQRKAPQMNKITGLRGDPSKLPELEEAS